MAKSITLRIGITTREEMKKRTVEIASGKRKRSPDEPRIWFTSMETVMRVLSDKNMLLLEMIRNSEPSSVTEVAEALGQAKSNVSRTLNKLEEFGLLDFEERSGGRRAPRVNYDSVDIKRSLRNAS